MLRSVGGGGVGGCGGGGAIVAVVVDTFCSTQCSRGSEVVVLAPGAAVPRQTQ